jgi:hypothetical protein
LNISSFCVTKAYLALFEQLFLQVPVDLLLVRLRVRGFFSLFGAAVQWTRFLAPRLVDG